MRAPYTQLFVHLVWATWDRLPLIGPDQEARIHHALRAKCEELDMGLLAVGGMPDHLHVLLRIQPALSISDVVRHLKGASSYWNSQSQPGEFFKWQGGYGAFTVSPRHLDAARDYVLDQRNHHAAGTVVAEFEASADASTRA